jgi:hypothetical protein
LRVALVHLWRKVLVRQRRYLWLGATPTKKQTDHSAEPIVVVFVGRHEDKISRSVDTFTSPDFDFQLPLSHKGNFSCVVMAYAAQAERVVDKPLRTWRPYETVPDSVPPRSVAAASRLCQVILPVMSSRHSLLNCPMVSLL